MTGRDADALFEAARDADKDVHNRAVAELAQLDPSILAAALAAAEARVRMAATRALAEALTGREPQAVAVEPLLAAAGDATWTVRGFALWGLGKCPGEEPAAAVAAALGDDDARVRRYAAHASRSLRDLLAARAENQSFRRNVRSLIRYSGAGR